MTGKAAAVHSTGIRLRFFEPALVRLDIQLADQSPVLAFAGGNVVGQHANHMVDAAPGWNRNDDADRLCALRARVVGGQDEARPYESAEHKHNELVQKPTPREAVDRLGSGA